MGNNHILDVGAYANNTHSAMFVEVRWTSSSASPRRQRGAGGRILNTKTASSQIMGGVGGMACTRKR